MDAAARGEEGRGPRIAAIDALRGFALVGVLAMNILAFGGPLQIDHPLAPASWGDPDWRAWWASQLVLEGQMRGLFSCLFGASFLLFIRAGPSPVRLAAFLRRAAWLVAFGVLNGTLLLWPGDVLQVYGLAAFLLLPFRGLSPARLFALGAAVLALASAMGGWRELAHPGAAPRAVDMAYALKALAEERAARLGGYPQTLGYMTATTLAWDFSVDFLRWMADAAGAMLVGMGLLKAGVLGAEARPRTYVLMALCGAPALGLNLAEAWAQWRDGFAHIDGWWKLTGQASRVLGTLGWIGVFSLAWQAAPARLFAPLTALGRMALTNYLAQSVVCAGIFSGFGLGLWGRLGWWSLWGLALAILAVQAVLSMLWLARFRHGPAEWLWRSLTWRRRIPIRAAPG